MDYVDSTHEDFQRSVAAVPSWMFLSWISQVMAVLSTPAAEHVVDLLCRVRVLRCYVKPDLSARPVLCASACPAVCKCALSSCCDCFRVQIAKEYPQAAYFPFRTTLECLEGGKAALLAPLKAALTLRQLDKLVLCLAE